MYNHPGDVGLYRVQLISNNYITSFCVILGLQSNLGLGAALRGLPGIRMTHGRW